MKKLNKKTLKRMRVPFLNTITSLVAAIWLFFGTVSTNLRLIGNWFSRMWEVDTPQGGNAWNQLEAELEAIRASSQYATFLTDCNILVTLLILIAEALIIVGLVWLAWQNFCRLVWAYHK